MLQSYSKREFEQDLMTRSPGSWTSEGTNTLYDYLEELNGEDFVCNFVDEDMGHYEYFSLKDFNTDMMTDFAVPEDAQSHEDVIAVLDNGHILVRQ